MLVGVLSDSHDRAEMLKAAVALLQQRGAAHILHCGDVCAPYLLDHLAGIPSGFVWGNCDWDRMSLARYAENIGVTCHGAYGDLELAGRRIALIHGDDHVRMHKLIEAQQHDYLFHGHTHVQADSRVGRTRVVNPGALFRARPKTVALLDLAADELQVLVVGE